MRRKECSVCGALTYEIEGAFEGVWMCHCSKCRKAVDPLERVVRPGRAAKRE